jgi:RHS repeat-associated protein
VNTTTVDFPFLFHGQQWDSLLGMYNMRARYYAPGIGRFLTPDPAGAANGLNMYAFCENDPVNRQDRTGLGSPGVHNSVTFHAVYQMERERTRPTCPSDEIPEGLSKQLSDAAIVRAHEVAVGVVAVDDLPNSQDHEHSFWHGMTDVYSGETRKESFDKFSDHVIKEAGSGTDEGLFKALHAVQDIVAGGHKLKDYFGEAPFKTGQFLLTIIELGTLSLAPGTPHWVDDCFPTKIETNLMGGLTKLVYGGDAQLAVDVLDVLLNIPGGAEGTAEVQKNGDVVVDFKDGRRVTFKDNGDLIVEGVPEQEKEDENKDDEDTMDWAIEKGVLILVPYIGFEVEGVVTPYDPADRRTPP